MERLVTQKIFWRIVPLLMIGSGLNYLDRVNISFAALTMNEELGLTATLFGFVAGVYFLGYFLFEVPSNLIMHRVGARRWLARIMITWGLIAAATGFVQGPYSLAILRFLLGLAEAGYTPGVLMYLTFWFPIEYRGRAIAWFLVAQTIATVLGASASGWLLAQDWFGLSGWRIMMIVEGLPAVLGGILVLFLLPDRPADAKWMSREERHWLEAKLANERRDVGQADEMNLLRLLKHGRVLALTAAYMCLCIAGYGFTFFLPQIVSSLDFNADQTGWLTAFAYACGGIAMVFWGRVSDRARNKEFPTVVCALLLSAGFVAAAIWGGTLWLIPAICLISIGSKAMLTTFWPIPSTFLSGLALSATFAGINSVGNLGGFISPILLGFARDQSGSYETGLYLSSAFAVLAGVFVALSRYLGRHQLADRRVPD